MHHEADEQLPVLREDQRRDRHIEQQGDGWLNPCRGHFA